MVLVYLKGCFTLLGKVDSDAKGNRLRLSVPLEGNPSVVVEIVLDEKSIESFHESEVSKEMWDILQTDITDGSKLPENLQNELSRMASDISMATRKALTLIKYCLYQTELNENLFSIKGMYWSADKVRWKPMPMILTATLLPLDYVKLNEDSVKIIQGYLDDGLEPFLALRHLQRAKKEGNPRYKWIDATIAAELAIKEFLMRIKPDVEVILLEVPAPPLDKLYGPILKFYTGQRSPKLRELSEGAQVRNRLVHRPKEIHIDRREAIKYVQDVETAIYHLLTLLYPDDPIVKRLSQPRVVIT